MATSSEPLRDSAPQHSVVEWLLDSDPAIRWQVMRDLLGAPKDDVAAERARVASEGYGARRSTFSYVVSCADTRRAK